MVTESTSVPAIIDALAPIAVATGVADQAEQLATLLPQLSRNQQRYLLARMDAESHAAAMKAIGLEPDTRTPWTLVPAFRQAEAVVIALSAGSRATFARMIAQMAAPTVMHRQVEQATETHDGKSDRQLMAQQRARAAVLDAAGVTSSPAAGAGEVERIDIIAARIWNRRKQPTQQPT